MMPPQLPICVISTSPRLTRLLQGPRADHTEDFRASIEREHTPFHPELRLSGDSDNVEEHERDQRRLFYVGMTRSEDVLVIGASDKVAKRGSGASRFIHDVGLSQFVRPDAVGAVDRTSRPLKRRVTVRTRLSYSALHNYTLCPRQYLLLHECGFAVPEHYWFNFGTMLHMALEVLHRKAKAGEQIDPALVEKIWHEAWRRGRHWEREQLERAEKLGLEYLHRYAEAHSERFGRVRWVEEPVDIPIGESFIVTGRMDLMCSLGDGVEVIDFKVRSRRGLDELRPELQIQTYGLAVQKKGEVGVSRVTLHLLAEPPGRDLISSDWTQTAGEQAERRLNTAAEGIARSDFRATAGPHCRLCDFRRLCPDVVVEVRMEGSDDEIPIGAAP